MKIPDDVEYVVTLSPQRMNRFGELRPPMVGDQKGLFLCEGYAITPKRFIAIVATCECSGYTTVKFLSRSAWYGNSRMQCRTCGVNMDSRTRKKKKYGKYMRKTKGWGII